MQPLVTLTYPQCSDGDRATGEQQTTEEPDSALLQSAHPQMGRGDIVYSRRGDISIRLAQMGLKYSNSGGSWRWAMIKWVKITGLHALQLTRKSTSTTVLK